MENLEAYNQQKMKLLRENIKLYRKARKLTQNELAELSQCSRCTILDAENGVKTKSFTVNTLLCIAKALEVDIGLLFCDHDDAEKKIATD